MRNDLRALLLQQQSITDIVGDGVYVNRAPQGAKLPYITITQLGSEEFKTLECTGGFRAVDLDVDCKHPTDSEPLSKIVREFIQDYSGPAGTQDIEAVLLNDETTSTEPPADGSDFGSTNNASGADVTTLDLTIQWNPK